MKLIKLTQGQFAKVDDDIFEELNQYKWHAQKWNGGYYARRRDGNKTIKMHRFIVAAPVGLVVDHKDHDTLNNQEYNLRLCTTGQNQMNKRFQSNCTSGYKGVSWHKSSEKWVARIQVNKNAISLGYFDCKILAAKKYNEAAIIYHGEYACLNKIEEK